MSTGFSLPELLIAMLILGEIATFTIPKVLTSSQNHQRKAVFRETIASINEIMYQGMMTGEITPSNNGTYIISKLNALKICQNVNTEGCWKPVMGSMSSLPGVVLPNGAVIAEMEDCCDLGGNEWANDIVIDWNGDKPPNVSGVDQLGVGLCFGKADCTQGWSSGKPGRLNAPPDFGSANTTLYGEIFR